MSSFVQWWQQLPQQLSPEIIHIGSFPLRWYSLSYILALLTIFFMAYRRIRTEPEYSDISKQTVDDSLLYILLGIIIGGKLGYILLYDFSSITHPLDLLPFSCRGGFHITGISGISYHGGVVGVLGALWLYCRRRKISLLRFLELFIPALPLGYTWGRLGNFMNGELFGRPTDVPWGMYFDVPVYRRLPNGQWVVGKYQQILSHPSQLYEAFFEGIVLFLILWPLRHKIRTRGVLTGIYLIGYGAVRFIIEFFRKPDAQFAANPNTEYGTVLAGFSMGQVLCALMILAGAVLIAYKKKRSTLGA